MSKYIDKVLFDLVSNFAQYHDEGYWWGHDTNLGKQTTAFNVAKKAINKYKREQTPAVSKKSPKATFTKDRRHKIAEVIFGKGKVPRYWEGSVGEADVLEKLANVKGGFDV